MLILGGSDSSAGTGTGTEEDVLLAGNSDLMKKNLAKMKLILGP